ncbi:hypothetical protein [Dyella sedimenti]|uniref:hypothetical protein n=1 Tax=Dyella sedimenti TaxID=2919947 RepID=UPI001FA98C46|nr:hypothetical protein [Dyella sedimenti]
MDADGQDLASMQHDGGAGSRDGASSSSGGDALGLSRENTVPASSGSSSCSDNCPSGSPVAPLRSRHANLGWQSLLPGSIQ